MTATGTGGIANIERIVSDDTAISPTDTVIGPDASQTWSITGTNDGTIAGDRVWLIDFDNADNNDWLALNQFTVIEVEIPRRAYDGLI